MIGRGIPKSESYWSKWSVFKIGERERDYLRSEVFALGIPC